MFVWAQRLADWLVYRVFGLAAGTHLAGALNFLIFDGIKIFLLLAVIVYAITFIRGFFPPEKTREILARNKGRTLIGHILAALLGIVTPFCSCSAVPLFIGFVEAGVPLGVTFSYLVAAPMVNEVALGLLYAMFGLRIALIYVLSGETIAVLSGLIIGRLGLERYVEEYVFKIKMGQAETDVRQPTMMDRLRDAWLYTCDLIKRIWPYVLIGIGIGGFMHGWVPANALARYAGKGNPFAVFIAVAVGVPLYSNAAGILPLIGELTRAGVAMGTSLAFMMAVTALSVPEMILLRRVLKPRLLAIFVGIVSAGIVFTGYLFNALL